MCVPLILTSTPLGIGTGLEPIRDSRAKTLSLTRLQAWGRVVCAWALNAL